MKKELLALRTIWPLQKSRMAHVRNNWDKTGISGLWPKMYGAFGPQGS